TLTARFVSLTAPLLAACTILATVAPTPPRAARGAEAERAAVWKLVSDYKLDGRLEPRETNFLSLTADGRRLAGHFLHKKASGKCGDFELAAEPDRPDDAGRRNP